MSILTSQDGSGIFRMGSIVGVKMYLDTCLYASLMNGREYWIGKFSSEKKAKEVMKCIWYAIDAGISYTVSPEV